MDSDWRKRIQIFLIIALVLGGLRVAWIFYERRQPVGPAAENKPTYSSNGDDYVHLPKIYSYDLASANRDLTGKTVWVRGGYTVPYYAYDPASGEVDLKHQKGLLPPLAKLQIQKVIVQRIPAQLKPGEVSVVQKQAFAIYKRAGSPTHEAVSIATVNGDDFTLTANETFFFADPHELYKHWPAETWAAIDRHEAKPGMSELQAGLALGTSASAGSGDYGNREIEYTNGGHPVKVSFQNNRATSVTPEAAK
jgi:hypothetical protein